LTEPRDYEHQKRGYYGKDHLLKDFLSSFLSLSSEKVLVAGAGRAECLIENPLWQAFDFNPNLAPLWQELRILDRCHRADARSLPFRDRSFDWTASTDFLEHVKVPDLPLVSSELRRVASSGRHVIDTTLESAYRTTTGETLHPAAGLTCSDWESVFPGSSCEPLKERPRYLLLEY